MYEKNGHKKITLTILMPCRNEETTVGICIAMARRYLEKNDICGEIVVADNGSTDHSAGIAQSMGARVIHVKQAGYGRALRAGIRASRGEVILIGDCDTTYDLEHVDPVCRPLLQGKYDVVIGDRFAGTIEPGAMPVSHRIGAEALSALGRLRYSVQVRDFHCGLRGITGSAVRQLRFRATGMEFATEMIAVSAAAGLRIGQVPVTLRRCRLPRSSKLRMIRDGLRHLRYMIAVKG